MCKLIYVFKKIIHEDLWEFDSYWCFGLQKDEDCEYLKEGNSTIGGICCLVFKSTKKKLSIMKVLCWKVLIDGVGRIALRDDCFTCMILLSELHWKCNVCGRLLVMGWR